MNHEPPLSFYPYLEAQWCNLKIYFSNFIFSTSIAQSKWYLYIILLYIYISIYNIHVRCYILYIKISRALPWVLCILQSPRLTGKCWGWGWRGQSSRPSSSSSWSPSLSSLSSLKYFSWHWAAPLSQQTLVVFSGHSDRMLQQVYYRALALYTFSNRDQS